MRRAGAAVTIQLMALAPLRSPPRRAALAEWLAPDSYFTDGRRLFRVVSQIAAGEDSGFAALEDCRSLEVHSYLQGELAGMRLRPVHPA
jgi:hypothetical protein